MVRAPPRLKAREAESRGRLGLKPLGESGRGSGGDLERAAEDQIGQEKQRRPDSINSESADAAGAAEA